MCSWSEVSSLQGKIWTRSGALINETWYVQKHPLLWDIYMSVHLDSRRRVSKISKPHLSHVSSTPLRVPLALLQRMVLLKIPSLSLPHSSNLAYSFNVTAHYRSSHTPTKKLPFEIHPHGFFGTQNTRSIGLGKDGIVINR